MQPRSDPDLLVDEAIDLVAEWLTRARSSSSGPERRANARLQGVIADPEGVAFAMRFVDRVIRPENNRVAAAQLASLVQGRKLPGFLSPIDRLLLRIGAPVARVLPGVVMPLAARRMRSLVGHLVVDAAEPAMTEHLGRRRGEGFRMNVNLLGEAVLGEAEAERRFAAATELMGQPDIDYVSVKVSAVVSQLNHWDFEGSVHRVTERLRVLYEKAASASPPTFVNLDMEEYHDLELTMAAFMALLDEPGLHDLDAGIVLQAYLPDSFDALRRLVEWATERQQRRVDGRPGGTIKIRLVKGANLAMERVDAVTHGWQQAPYPTKADADANYKRCVDWVATPERTGAVRVGLASHNLFDVAWARLLGVERGVADRIEFEMLQGMAPAHARVVRDDGDGLLLYTPVVAPADFDVAISYLFRRLEENASEENFIHHLFALEPGSPAFESEAMKFRTAVGARDTVDASPRRRQDRRRPPNPRPTDLPFDNEPDTDPALPANRVWAADVARHPFTGPSRPIAADVRTVDHSVAAAREGQLAWQGKSSAERREALHGAADELARRRGDLVAAMVREASKTIAQADPEVSEAIDFARWYGDRALDLDRSPSARFEPLGVVAVVPPWNFPVAIPAGGVFAALAAGNGVVLKPAPETPSCAEIVAECCHAVGISRAVQYLRTPDDEIGRHLITHPDLAAVILTGAYETATLFRSWKPDLRIFAETSGKNSLVITPNADIDLAVADLVASAFGHGGQKCSAASLAICVGDLYDSPRLRRQLVDAVRSLEVGPAENLATTMAPTIHEPDGKLLRALTELDPGEEWLVEPRRLGDRTWSPGVRLGVVPGSWFHQTECFGPVLGLLRATDLDAAIRIQNATSYGLTGGIHSLDVDEVERWVGRVEVGNVYVNRPTTGAIVRRQPFGGWKRSVVGPGAKAGGPNYVARLGTWQPTDTDLDDQAWLATAEKSDARWWNDEFSIDHDPSGLFCEANVFRYRPLPRIGVRVGPGAAAREVERVLAAAARCGVITEVSKVEDETAEQAAATLVEQGVERIRTIGRSEPALRDAALAAGVHVADEPVTTDGRIELLHYLREQSISRTLHRYGNLL